MTDEQHVPPNGYARAAHERQGARMTRGQAIDEAVRRHFSPYEGEWRRILMRATAERLPQYAGTVNCIRAEFARIMAEQRRTERSVRGAPIPGFRNLRTSTLPPGAEWALTSWVSPSGRSRDPESR